MDKIDFKHFVNSVRWHCTILTKTTRFNGDIDRAGRGYVTFNQNIRKCRFVFALVDLEDWRFQQISDVI